MIGKTLGHFRIIEKIIQGGMGEVLLAEDASLHRKVALNVLPSEMRQDDTARIRFIREARSAAALDHPYICHINEVGREGHDPNLPYVACGPEWDPLRSKPGFQALRGGMNLP